MATYKAILALALLLTAAFAACDAALSDVVIGTSAGCPDGLAPSLARVYAGEDFFICGKATLNGEPLASGSIRGFTPALMDADAAIETGSFSLPAKADTELHKVYYLQLGLTQPCNATFEAIPVEVKTACNMLPPSTIEAVPNTVTQGSQFTLQVKNAPEDMTMEVTGLAKPHSARIARYGSWTESVASEECSALGSCVITFKFIDANHPICEATSTMVVTVRAPEPAGPAGRDDTTALLAITLLVLVLGIGGAVVLNRFL